VLPGDQRQPAALRQTQERLVLVAVNVVVLDDRTDAVSVGQRRKGLIHE